MTETSWIAGVTVKLNDGIPTIVKNLLLEMFAGATIHSDIPNDNRIAPAVLVAGRGRQDVMVIAQITLSRSCSPSDETLQANLEHYKQRMNALMSLLEVLNKTHILHVSFGVGGNDSDGLLLTRTTTAWWREPVPIS